MPTELSSRPERTRISCYSALTSSHVCGFRKESRMKFANATNLNRKSGVAQWRDLRFSSSSHADTKARTKSKRIWAVKYLPYWFKTAPTISRQETLYAFAISRRSLG